MKHIAIHQPNYIPWLGYFYKIHEADVFVFLDDVQFSNEGMHNYHYIKTNNGPFKLKIPVKQTLGDKINEVRIRQEIDWQKKHLKLIYENYKSAPFFGEVFNDFETIIREPFEFLVDLNLSLIKLFCQKLGIKYSFKRSSDFKIHSTKEARIIEICKALGADAYVSGIGAKAYQSEANFSTHGIQLLYTGYKVFSYEQQFTGFQANVTVMDFLMNCGYNWQYVLDNQG